MDRTEEPRDALGWGTLDRQRIVEAALELARTDGLPSVTIRRVAQAVGASRMALYRHVHDKADLLGLVSDEIARLSADLPIDESAAWDVRLHAIATSLRAQLSANPAFAEFMVVHSAHGPGGVQMAELITRAVAATGLAPGRVAHFCLVFSDIVLGRIHREIAGDPTAATRNARLLDAAQQIPEAHTVRRYDAALRQVRAEDVFESEVSMVIAAIRAEVDRAESVAGPHAG
jgi:AcrR family transcriptional regulator